MPAEARQSARFSILKTLAFLQATFLISSSFAAEWPTEQALKVCRRELSEKGAKLVDRWLTKPLPSDYRTAMLFDLRYGKVDGWTEYKNPNGTSTIVIRTASREPRERSFNILIKNNDGLVKADSGDTFNISVSAFEFARSNSEHNGMTGLFFCGKHGPSAEWVWDRTNWKVDRRQED